MRITVLALLTAFLIGALRPNAVVAQEKKEEPKVIEVGKPEPSPIPEKLMADAKKVFAQKKFYYIWTEAKAAKAADVKLLFAINPDFKEEKAHTVAKLTYTARNGMKVPYSSIGEGIQHGVNGPGGYKFTTDVSIYLIRGSDVISKDGVLNKNPEKLPPISNTITVKVTFE